MSNKRIRLNPAIMRPPPIVNGQIDGRAWAKLMQEMAGAADLTEDIEAGTGNNYVLARYVRLAASSLPTVSDTATTSRDTGFKVHSSASYKTTANGRCYFGASSTDYIHTIPANESWIISAYVKGGNASLGGKLGVKTANGTYTTAITTAAVAGTVTRVSGVLDLESDAATACVVFIDNDETSENIWFADLMLEPREGTDTEASPFAFPSPGLAEDVVIDGSHIRLGQTDYDTGTGFWIGDDSGTPKLSLGTSSNGITWNGSTFEVRGTSVAGSFVVTTGGNVRMGQTGYNTGTGFWIGSDSGTAKMSLGSSSAGFTWDGTTFTVKGTTVSGSYVISTGGNIRQGQTDYDTGTGFWLGDDSGTPKLSLGNSSGAKLTWNGSTLTVTYADGTTIETLKPSEAGADVTGNNTANNTSNVGTVAVSNAQADLLTVESLVSANQLRHVNGSPAGIISTDPQAIGATQLSFFHTDNELTNPDGAGITFDSANDPNTYTDSQGEWFAVEFDGRHAFRFALGASTNLTSAGILEFGKRNIQAWAGRCRPGQIMAALVAARHSGTAIANGTWNIRLDFYDKDDSLLSFSSGSTNNNTALTSSYVDYTQVFDAAPAGTNRAVLRIQILSSTNNTSGSAWGWNFADARLIPQRATNDVARGAITNTRAAGLLAANRTQAMNGSTTSPLTATDVGSSATINVAAWSRRVGETVSYNSGSIVGLTFSTKYYVYLDDATITGGAVTYSALTEANRLNLASAEGRIFVDWITTPANGAGNTGGNGENIEP